MSLKFVDTFAGVGGFHVGTKKVLPDAECVLAVEWDKDAQYSYHENFPETPIFGDITELTEIPDHDLLTGGFPCQPFSINKQSSVKKVYDEEDNRSNLFLQLVRIAELKQPKYLLFENVAALASMKNKDGGLVIEEIKYAFEQIGYNVDYRVYDAADFGVPQQRKRVFIIGKRKDLNETINWPEPEYKPVAVKDILDEGEIDPKRFVNLNSKTCTSRCYHKDDDMSVPWSQGNRYYCNKSNKNDDKVYKWVGSGSSEKLEETDLNKKDMVWQDKEEAFKESSRDNNPIKDGRLVITPKSIIMYDTPSKISRQHERIYSIQGISRTLATFGHPLFEIDGRWRYLTGTESARLQGFPVDNGYKVHPKHGTACKHFGNAVCVNVVEAIVKVNFK